MRMTNSNFGNADKQATVNRKEVLTKSNLHYTRRITPKRVTSCRAHLRGLAPGTTAPKKRRNGGESLATLCRFDRPGSRTPDLPHR